MPGWDGRDYLQGLLLRRLKRFTVEVLLPSGIVKAHCNNTGAMLGLIREGEPVILSKAPNPDRKLPYTLEMINAAGQWVGVNTLFPNRFLAHAFHTGLLDFCAGYATLKREVKFGQSRLDGLITGPSLPDLWVECKNVTLVEDGIAWFPDARSERAARHVMELMELARHGHRAGMLFVVQRSDANWLAAADFIDENYSRLFHKALNQGVEAWAYALEPLPGGYASPRKIPLCVNNESM